MASRATNLSPRLRILPVTPGRWPDLARLFGKNGACAGCWCMFWKQTGPEFHARRGPRNRAALRRLVQAGEVPGLLAYARTEPSGWEAVGWVAVEPRDRYPRLQKSRTLGPVDEQPVWSAPCFYVARGWRRKGLAAELLAAAARHARKEGAAILEGYPVDSRKPLAAAWLYTGSASTFARLGFEEVIRRSRTRPVVRLSLRRGRSGKQQE